MTLSAHLVCADPAPTVLSFPRSTIIKDVVSLCRRNDFTDIVILHETRGEPDGMIISHLPYGPTAYFNLTNCVMRHDIAKEKGEPLPQQPLPPPPLPWTAGRRP